MEPSFEKIDYKLRPAKAIERKMIVDTIRRLSNFSKIEQYRYIGFGSIYFADFSLFHKALGIYKMITIEQDSNYKKRVEFNLPFSCIELKNDYSYNVLPILDWEDSTIVWLDYDKKIQDYYLSDIQTVCSNIKSGGLLLITVNANPETNAKLESAQLDKLRLDTLIKQIGEKKIPMGTTGKKLAKDGLSTVLREIFINKINECLKDRNSLLKDEEQLEFKQLFNFKYEDGATMLTVGGIIHEKRQQNIFDSCSFGDLEFLSFDEKEYKIQVPKLTLKEVSYLDSKIHKYIENNNGDIKIIRKHKNELSGLIPEGDVIKYSKIYRYYPNFTESIL